MKRFYVLSVAACFFAGSFLTSCKKENDSPAGNSSITSIDAKVEDGAKYNSEFDKVKAVMYSGEDDFIAGESKYSNGGFRIQLPATVNPKYLSPIVDEKDLIGSWMKISDKTVLLGGINLEAYDPSGDYLGDFYYMNSSFDLSTNKTGTVLTLWDYEGAVVYCDKDVKLTGSTEEEETMEGSTVKLKVKANAALKKGWNFIYMTMDITIKANGGTVTSSTGTVSIITSKPDGMKWYYEDDAFDDFDLSGTNFKSFTPGTDRQLSNDVQKILSKYRFFTKTKSY
jgi:hypothetical protein